MTENQKIESEADKKQGISQKSELQSWIGNVIVPILVQMILKERRQCMQQRQHSNIGIGELL